MGVKCLQRQKEEDMTLKQKVLLRLIKLNMTQAELAQLLDVSQQLLSQVLKGTSYSIKVEVAIEEWLKKKPI